MDAGVRKRLKITATKIYRVSVGGRYPVLVQVLTDAGISGVGEAAVAYGLGASAAAAMVKELAEKIVLGKDPFTIEALWSEMYDHSFWAKGGGPIVLDGISAIEQALWDIKGKARGVPVYEMLGGRLNLQHNQGLTPLRSAQRASAQVEQKEALLEHFSAPPAPRRCLD